MYPLRAARNHASMQAMAKSPLQFEQLSLLRDAKEPLQVRIPSSVKRRFKAAAALRGIDANVLFIEMWDHYERTHPDGSRQGITG